MAISEHWTIIQVLQYDKKCYNVNVSEIIIIIYYSILPEKISYLLSGHLSSD